MLSSYTSTSGVLCLLFSLCSAQSFATVAYATVSTPSPTTASAHTIISSECPIITSHVRSPSCTASPTRFCATPDCILLSTITHSCNCPSTISTIFSHYPCNSCYGGCGTAYSTVYVPCATSRASSSSSKSAKS